MKQTEKEKAQYEQFKVEIVQNGHEIKAVNLSEIERLQQDGFWIAVQDASRNMRMLHELNAQDLRQATRIIASRALRGG